MHASRIQPHVRRRAAAGERGQAAALALIALTTVAIALIAALAGFGSLALDRSAAQTAADAAALAAVVDGRPAAEALARANGGVLVELVAGPGPDEVTVTVRVGDAIASARATDAP